MREFRSVSFGVRHCVYIEKFGVKTRSVHQSAPTPHLNVGAAPLGRPTKHDPLLHPALPQAKKANMTECDTADWDQQHGKTEVERRHPQRNAHREQNVAREQEPPKPFCGR